MDNHHIKNLKEASKSVFSHVINTTTKGIVLHENDNLLCIKETLSDMKGLRNIS
jgi:hypothetical protein